MHPAATFRADELFRCTDVATVCEVSSGGRYEAVIEIIAYLFLCDLPVVLAGPSVMILVCAPKFTVSRSWYYT